jgi:hypothetical protein
MLKTLFPGVDERIDDFSLEHRAQMMSTCLTSVPFAEALCVVNSGQTPQSDGSTQVCSDLETINVSVKTVHVAAIPAPTYSLL